MTIDWTFYIVKNLSDNYSRCSDMSKSVTAYLVIIFGVSIDGKNIVNSVNGEKKGQYKK